jgi:hypothetical protein
MHSYLRASTILFGLLATVQLIRLIRGWPIVVAGLSIPVWVSGIAVLIVGSMAVWGMRTLARTRAGGASV